VAHARDSKIALAAFDGQVIGYAIAVQVKVKDYGVISWVTQLVIHEAHRRRDVGKTLLFSIWGFSDHFAWGLITANPYAIRALEKATRRRCSPERMGRNHRKLKAIGIEQTPYVKEETAVEVTAETSRIRTEFFLDHSQLDTMLASAAVSAPWLLGNLPEGWEWLAFTFHDQTEIELSPDEIDKMIKASDQVTKQAYSRMRVSSSHRWAQHTLAEARQIADLCNLTLGQSILDLGCGSGRHALELAAMGMNVTGRGLLDDIRRRGAGPGEAPTLGRGAIVKGGRQNDQSSTAVRRSDFTIRCDRVLRRGSREHAYS
jgi:GNAT superfamily N-acetyltransferase